MNSVKEKEREWKKIWEGDVKYEIFGAFLEPANLKEIIYFQGLQILKEHLCWVSHC